jgi:integrase
MWQVDPDSAETPHYQGELLGLQWKDADLHEGVLHVRRQSTRSNEYGPTKTPAGVRRLTLPNELTQFLIELKVRSDHSKRRRRRLCIPGGNAARPPGCHAAASSRLSRVLALTT